MLEELSVRDFALIDRLAVSFTPGFTVLSGETGAGKSLLIGAIGFLLGARADAAVIRTGAEEALVAGIFDISSNPEARAWLSSRGLEADESRVSIRRSLRSTGRSSVLIQNQAFLRNDLVEFTSLMVDIHGQHENQSLLQPASHRALLDRQARLLDEVAAYSASFAELTKRRKDFESALASEEQRSRELEFLRFSVEEIEAAKLRPGEDTELTNEERLLSQHEKLLESVESAHSVLHDEGSPSSDGLSALRRMRASIEMALAIDPSLSEISRRAEDAYFELEDIADSLRRYSDGIAFSPDRLEAIEARLADLGRLRKKYGDSAEKILERLSADRERLALLETWEEDKAGLAADLARLEAEVYAKAIGLSERRVAAARELSSGVEKILAVLGMASANFVVRVERKGSKDGQAVIGQFGLDEVEFLIAPNPGEPLKPLARIASGGELSRIALAAKTIFAQSDTASTLIFDEIDAGIGGEVAVSAGEHLEALGNLRQVLCITHLASIAARADNHYRVEKLVEGGRTSTRLSRVEGRPRAEELARMLAGDPEEEASIAHATELLRKYGHWRD